MRASQRGRSGPAFRRRELADKVLERAEARVRQQSIAVGAQSFGLGARRSAGAEARIPIRCVCEMQQQQDSK